MRNLDKIKQINVCRNETRITGKIIICNILFKKNDFSKIYSQSHTRRLQAQIPIICNNIRDISENMF